MTLLDRIAANHHEFLEGDFKLLGRKNTSAIVISEFMVDFYTCLETCFLRISQFFENNLSADRWHADLLEKIVEVAKRTGITPKLGIRVKLSSKGIGKWATSRWCGGRAIRG